MGWEERLLSVKRKIKTRSYPPPYCIANTSLFSLELRLCSLLRSTSHQTYTMQKPDSPQDIMSDDWFAYKLAPDGDVVDGCHPDEAQALKDYLRRKTSTTEAAQAITRPLVAASDPRDDIVRLWGILMDALVELPSDNTDRLIALVSAIDNLPEPDFSAVEESKRPREKLWKGLPGFGNLWADIYQSSSWRASVGGEGEEREERRDEYIKTAACEARLVASGLAGLGIDCGYQVVADALESSNALLDFEVPAAAEWLVCCGQRLRQGAARSETSWALTPRQSEAECTSLRDLWTARLDGTMTLKRWKAWQDRLVELQKDGEREDVQTAARRALEAMRSVDRVL
ncbi:hypothetical protein NX059_001704 [Plenodomus lindquistii]|nr:hypothetical protein NX059_001704 [Plenodomus lindquistii]